MEYRQYEYTYNSCESLSDQMEHSYDQMVARDAEAKAEGTIVGRYLKERAADGYAFYEVIAVNGDDSLQIECLDIYDCWSVPMYESMADCFPRNYAEGNIAARESTEALFNKK